MSDTIVDWKATAMEYAEALRTRERELEEARDEIAHLEQWVNDCQSGMYINCVYCGHRYGPDDGDHLNSMRDALRAHIEKCPKHPLSALRRRCERLEDVKRIAGQLLDVLDSDTSMEVISDDLERFRRALAAVEEDRDG